MWMEREPNWRPQMEHWALILFTALAVEWGASCSGVSRSLCCFWKHWGWWIGKLDDPNFLLQ